MNRKHINLCILLAILVNSWLFGQYDDASHGNPTSETELKRGDHHGRMYGHLESSRPRLGIQLIESDHGMVVDHIIEGSAAAQSTLRTGDVITAIDDQRVTSISAIGRYLDHKAVGDVVYIHFIRKNKSKQTSITLEERHHSRLRRDCKHLNQPCLGIFMRSVQGQGVRVTGLFEGSGAMTAELQDGDLIQSIDGQPMMFEGQVDRYIKAQVPGSLVQITLKRGQERLTVDASIGVWDDCGVCRLMNVDEMQEEQQWKLTLPLLELQSFEVYPVPASDQITIKLASQAGPIELSLYDASGHKIYARKDHDFAGESTYTIDLIDAARGMAIILIEQDGHIFSKKFLLQ